MSPPAVSMGLRGHTRISQETRQKILRIAKRLNYQPNFVARSLVMKKTNTIGLIITSILNPFCLELAKGIEDKAMELGYKIIVCSTNYLNQCSWSFEKKASPLTREFLSR